MQRNSRSPEEGRNCSRWTRGFLVPGILGSGQWEARGGKYFMDPQDFFLGSVGPSLHGHSGLVPCHLHCDLQTCADFRTEG